MRRLRAVLILTLVFFVAACASTGQKPEAAASPFAITDTKQFFGDTIQFERQGKAGEIMDKAEDLQKKISKENSDPNVEMSTYRLYVKADVNHNHVITEQNALAFWKWYQAEFDAHVGSIKWR